eukprot:4999498-Pleurochrysis_carterae.AAC.7
MMRKESVQAKLGCSAKWRCVSRSCRLAAVARRTSDVFDVLRVSAAVVADSNDLPLRIEVVLPLLAEPAPVLVKVVP